MSPIAVVGWSAAAVLLLLWLVISLRARGRGRDVLEWLAATCLYVALSMVFLNLVLRMRASGSTLGLLAFGFLLLLFAGGGVVSLVNALHSLRSAGHGQASATN
jgi:hypothetical protein